MIVGTLGTGYVGDQFLYAVKKKVRLIMGTSANEEVEHHRPLNTDH
jgi:hypothetical protein